MTERWQRELRRLRTVAPQQDLWGRIQRRAAASTLPAPRVSPLVHRFAVALVALVIFAPVAFAGWNILSDGGPEPATPIPGPTVTPTLPVGDVARVTCGEERTLVEPSLVALSWAGLSLDVDWGETAYRIAILYPDNPSKQTVLTRGQWPNRDGSEQVVMTPPGRALIACFNAGEPNEEILSERGAPLRIVHAHGAWPPDIGPNFDVRPCPDRAIPPVASAPAPSPDSLSGSLVLRIRGEGFGGNLFEVPAARGSAAPLALGLESAFYPAISPDGTRVAFAEQGIEGSFDIFVMDVDGSDRTRLTDSTGSDYLPDWSPDGTRIAYVSNREGPSRIFITDADGTDDRRLTDSVWGSEFSPDWSPDGSRILLASDRGAPSIRCRTGNTIFVTDVDGSFAGRLTRIASEALDPVWSPDGSRIALLRNYRRDGPSEIYVLDLRSGREVRLTDYVGHDVDAAWSPDGRFLAFSSGRGESGRDRGKFAVFVVRADGSDAVRVAGWEEADAHLIDWLPDLETP